MCLCAPLKLAPPPISKFLVPVCHPSRALIFLNPAGVWDIDVAAEVKSCVGAFQIPLNIEAIPPTPKAVLHLYASEYGL